MPKNASFFSCSICSFKCSKKSNYDKHLSTRKHKTLTNLNIINSTNASKRFVCQNCNKIYKHASTFSTHKKMCKLVIASLSNSNININSNSNSDMNSLSFLVVELIKNNQEFQKQILEFYKNNTPIAHNISDNTSFNLNFLLSEQFNDAINLMDFVDTFKLQFYELKRIGEVGYVEGMSDIIIDKLNKIDIYKRPIQSNDINSDTFYVKYNNKWVKENDNYNKLRLAIKHITIKNIDVLNELCYINNSELFDNYNYPNDTFFEIAIQVMGGRGEVEENENKIIKKIAKTVFIGKDS
jgi:hypothetical protein